MKKTLLSLSALFFALPGAAQNCDSDAGLTPIAQIQGSATQSPKLGEQITTIGVVTQNWSAQEQLGGLFLQSTQQHQDNDSNTSEGLFINASGKVYQDIKAGTLLKVTGTVSETDGLTMLTNTTAVFECGQAEAVSPVELTLPFTSEQQAEAHEGMLVTVSADQPLTISGHYPLARHGYFDVSAGRLWTPTQIAKPGAAAQALAKSNQLNRLQIDDNSQTQPQQLPHQQLFHGPQNSLRSGATIKPVTGILSQFRDDYRLQPTTAPQLDQRSQITAIVPKLSDNIRIASFNVLNYFNGDGQGNGFPTERGARSPAQLQRQQDKLVAAITALKADVVGLMEVENDGFEPHSAIRELVDAINDASRIDYAIAQPRSTRVGTDQISVGIIYNPQRLTPVSHAATLEQGPFRRGSRVPLAQTFKVEGVEQPLTVVVNHFKSKGSCPDDGINANQNDGQACWNALRVESAQELLSWIEQQQLPNPVLLGDFNAYYQEDPIQYFIENGYHNVSDAKEYSYVYDSQAGSLDHIFVHQSLVPKVSHTQHVNFNADEPVSYDYRDADYYQPGPYRSSDHDPLLLDLSWSEDD